MESSQKSLAGKRRYIEFSPISFQFPFFFLKLSLKKQNSRDIVESLGAIYHEFSTNFRRIFAIKIRLRLKLHC